MQAESYLIMIDSIMNKNKFKTNRQKYATEEGDNIQHFYSVNISNSPV